ncbi:sugar-binding transcriptional regulator [Anaerobranca gottschalkii]|uniref:Central glycolytic genes regulator n=1 Tax=Anaerobranca gottschalkii DSM 13577 TaxID=1120990 RepID=A0A1I0AHP8_9FIRM|nr:sugar-binding domain-containing protein [Anaerobranca gottschalkii]SES93804.1 central glycolytic genes regulator [Anaerobranca gottschalkii DSM 13577]
MKPIIQIQKKIAPETIEIIKKRHNILRTIAHLQPIGRRGLANQMGLGERVLRTEIDFLKSQGFINVNPSGMNLTEEGIELLTEMADYVKELLDLKNIEEQLEIKLGIGQVNIVPGDSNENPLVKKELGKAAAKVLQRFVNDGDIIAVTGGTTIATIPENLPKLSKNVLVVPGRGALGEKVEIQANTIVAAMATQLGGNYKMLHVPENLSPEAMEKLTEDPKIQEVLQAIRKANILIHGIGDALEMAKRRGTSEENLRLLEKKEAVAEAFGYYFDKDGNIVHQANSVGLRLEDLEKIPLIIAIAGGKDKAKAIKSIAASKKQHILITDEGAALELLKLC